jgi:hypothetical protein
MSLTEHATHLAGKPVALFDGRAPFDAAAMVPRLALDWEAHVDGLAMDDLFGELLRRPDASKLEGLVFGVWDFLDSIDSSSLVGGLVAARDRLPALRALFVGDIVESEQELAWIAQGNLSPVFRAFPRLEELRVRGSTGLALAHEDAPIAHARLQSLIVESAGLSREVVRSVLAAELPALTHLELWLGSEAQGATASLDDFAALVAGDLFPSLRSLALKNAETADGLAAAIAGAPLLERLDKLDLSLGTLSDEGAEALLASPAVRQLRDLDVRKSYLSSEMVKRLHTLNPVIVDVRGSRFGKDDGERRPSTVPGAKAREAIELPLARFRSARRA